MDAPGAGGPEEIATVARPIRPSKSAAREGSAIGAQGYVMTASPSPAPSHPGEEDPLVRSSGRVARDR